MTVNQAAARAKPANFMIAHLPASDIDRRILGTDMLLEGGTRAGTAVTTLRRDAALRKLIHLPALLVAAGCGLVIMDLTASGSDPFNTWPLPATLAVIIGWLAALAYLGTFRTQRLKAFHRCLAVPVGVMAPELPALVTAREEGRDLLAEALCREDSIEGENLNYDSIQRRLDEVLAALR